MDELATSEPSRIGRLNVQHTAQTKPAVPKPPNSMYPSKNVTTVVIKTKGDKEGVPAAKDTRTIQANEESDQFQDQEAVSEELRRRIQQLFIKEDHTVIAQPSIIANRPDTPRLQGGLTATGRADFLTKLSAREERQRTLATFDHQFHNSNFDPASALEQSYCYHPVYAVSTMSHTGATGYQATYNLGVVHQQEYRPWTTPAITYVTHDPRSSCQLIIPQYQALDSHTYERNLPYSHSGGIRCIDQTQYQSADDAWSTATNSQRRYREAADDTTLPSRSYVCSDERTIKFPTIRQTDDQYVGGAAPADAALTTTRTLNEASGVETRMTRLIEAHGQQTIIQQQQMERRGPTSSQIERSVNTLPSVIPLITSTSTTSTSTTNTPTTSTSIISKSTPSASMINTPTRFEVTSSNKVITENLQQTLNDSRTHNQMQDSLMYCHSLQLSLSDISDDALCCLTKAQEQQPIAKQNHMGMALVDTGALGDHGAAASDDDNQTNIFLPPMHRVFLGDCVRKEHFERTSVFILEGLDVCAASESMLFIKPTRIYFDHRPPDNDHVLKPCGWSEETVEQHDDVGIVMEMDLTVCATHRRALRR